MLCDRSEHSLSPNFSPTVFTRNTDLYETNANNPPINAPPSYSTYINLSQRAAADRNGLLSSYRGSPYQQIDGTKPSTLMRRNSDPNSQQSTQSSCDSLEEEDKPLDMSNKKYRNQEWSESQSSPPPPELRSDLSLSRSPMNSPSNIFGQQMMRPSVITCAPSLKSQPNESPLQSLSPTFNCQNCCTNGDQLGDSVGDHNACKRHRNRQLYVTEEVSDPVIEEHFRRSLGKDYSQIFSNSTNNNSITYSGNYFLKFVKLLVHSVSVLSALAFPINKIKSGFPFKIVSEHIITYSIADTHIH